MSTKHQPSFRSSHRRAMSQLQRWLDATRCDARLDAAVREHLTKAADALHQTRNHYEGAAIHATGKLP